MLPRLFSRQSICPLYSLPPPASRLCVSSPGAASSSAAAWPLAPRRSATSKAGGSTKNGRDSAPKYLGVKLYGGAAVSPGNIILRQRGARFGIVESTATVAFGRDWTIFALREGTVHFWHHAMRRKHYVEVLRSAPGEPLAKYPIVRCAEWELPGLLRLPAETPLADAVRDRLLAYLRAVPPAQLRTLLPRGTPAIGGVDAIVWGGDAAEARGGAEAEAAAEAAVAAQAA